MSNFSESVKKRIFDTYPDKQGMASFANLPQSIQDAVDAMILPFESGDNPLFVDPETCPDWLIERFEKQVALFLRIEENKKELKLINDNISAKNGLLNAIKQLVFVDFNSVADVQVNREKKEKIKKELQKLENQFHDQKESLSGIYEAYKLIKDENITEEDRQNQLIKKYELLFEEELKNLHENFNGYSRTELTDYLPQLQGKALKKLKITIEEMFENKDLAKEISGKANAKSSQLIKKLVEFYYQDMKTFPDNRLIYDLAEELRIFERNKVIKESIRNGNLKNTPSLNRLLSQKTFFSSTEEFILSAHTLMELENINIETKKRIGLEIAFKHMDEESKMQAIIKLTRLMMEIRGLESKISDEPENLEQLKGKLEVARKSLSEDLDLIASPAPTNSLSLSLKQQVYSKGASAGTWIYNGIGTAFNYTIAIPLGYAAGRVRHALPAEIQTALTLARPASGLVDRINYMLSKKDTDTALQIIFKWLFATLTIGISFCLIAAITYLLVHSVSTMLLAKSASAILYGSFFTAAMIAGTFLGASKLINFIRDNKLIIRNKVERLIYGAKDHERFLVAEEVRSKYNQNQLYALQAFFLKEINDLEIRLEAMRPDNPRLSTEQEVHDNLMLCWEQIRDGAITKPEELNYYLSKIYTTWSNDYNGKTHKADDLAHKLKSFMLNIETNGQLFEQFSPDMPASHSLVSSIKPYLGLGQSHPKREPALAPMSDPVQIKSCKHLKALQNAETLIADLPRLR